MTQPLMPEKKGKTADVPEIESISLTALERFKLMTRRLLAVSSKEIKDKNDGRK